METKQIDKLFLELSQFTRARTRREIELQEAVNQLEIELELVKESKQAVQNHPAEYEILIGKYKENLEIYEKALSAIKEHINDKSEEIAGVGHFPLDVNRFITILRTLEAELKSLNS